MRFENLSRSLRIAARFATELKVNRRSLCLVVGLYLCVIGLEVARPWPLRWLIDDALQPTGVARGVALGIVWQAAVALLLILGAKAVAEYLASLRMTEVGHEVSRSMRLRIFRHMVELSPDYHARNKSGDMLVRLIGDVPMVKDMLVDAAVQIGIRGLQALVIVGVMVAVDPILAAAVLLPMPVLAISMRVLSNRLRIAVRKQRRKEGEMANYLHEAIAATTVVQSLGGGGHVVRRFARSNRRYARAGLKCARAAARLSGTVELLLALAFSTAVMLGGYRVVGGHISAGELIVFLSYVRSLLKPVRAAAKHQGRIAKGTACGERILSVLDQDIELRRDGGSELPSKHPSELSFEGVSYTYPDGSRALEDVSFSCRRGAMTALTGPSGAGKSTLVALAMRLFDPSSGIVRLDGVPLPQLELDALRDGFAISMQSTVLFGESLRENLWLGRPDAQDEDMWSALEMAGVAEVVRALPEGLDSVLGSVGAGLSGGESRRICLARALLRESAILVVDEPFSGLDHETIARVADCLHEQARRRIVLVITHHPERLGPIQQTLRLRGGRLQSVGKDSEVEVIECRS